MAHFKYIIIGGGMTADAAVKGIRKKDPKGTIGLVSNERHPPYARPPLSKALWKGEPLESIWRKTPGSHLTMMLNTRADSIHSTTHTVTVEGGGTHTYEKLLLAMGGKVRTLPNAPDGVIYFRTLDDYQSLRNATAPGATCVVIGGGFIGSEIAAALSMNGWVVTMVFPEEGIGARIYPPALSRFLNGFFTEKGVRVIPGTSASSIRKEGKGFVVSTDKHGTLAATAVIAGLGIVPDTDLAATAGISVENGILVNQRLETSVPDVFAAGDVANVFNPALGKRIRVEHEDNAIDMGTAAGTAMAGGDVHYDHLPFFYSDLFDLGYEAVGELDSRLRVIEDWKEPFRKGVLYYMDGGRVRGVLLWNTWGQVDAARELIAASGPFAEGSLAGRIHD